MVWNPDSYDVAKVDFFRVLNATLIIANQDSGVRARRIGQLEWRYRNFIFLRITTGIKRYPNKCLVHNYR